MGKAFIIHNISFLSNNIGTVTFVTNNQSDQPIDLNDALMFTNESVFSDSLGLLAETPALINTYDVKVTYSSTNTSVATVDYNGAVTIMGNGQTQIIASFAGNDQYNAKSVMYTITVNIQGESR